MIYNRKPSSEIEKLCHDYNEDEPEAITAVETPQAIEAEPTGKRSGVYARKDTPAELVAAARARSSGEG
jgi:hypothetical protein